MPLNVGYLTCDRTAAGDEVYTPFDNKEICESDMEWQKEMRINMTNQSRSCGAKSFKAKKAKRKMVKKSRRKNR